MSAPSSDVLALLAATPDAVVIADADGRIVAFNPSAEEMFGYRAQDALGNHVGMLLSTEGLSGPEFAEGHLLAADSAPQPGKGRDVRARHRDGSEFPVFLSAGRIPESDPPQYIGYLHDNLRGAALEARSALERMNSVSRLATMGEMAAGISHELNQPLAAIANYAQACVRLLRHPTPDIGEVDGALRQISNQALRAGEIIRRIRSLVRNEDVRRQPRDINHLIREVHSLLASDARVHDGCLDLDLCEALPRVVVDEVQIQQVLMNLVHNAFEAFTTQAETAADCRAEVSIVTRPTAAGDVEVSVLDRGPGLEPHLEQKIFEPFFTTKSSGTGLGLAISRSIIKAHGSLLRYRANPDRGACFYFVLPAHVETAQ